MERKFIKKVQWGLADTTTTNTGPYAGCHAVLRRHMQTNASHILYFLILCLAHPANNECQSVMRSAPARPERQSFSRSKRVQSDLSVEPCCLAVLFDDIGYLGNRAKGLREYLRQREGRKRRVRKAVVGNMTRWCYHVDFIEWMLEHPDRLNHLVLGLILFWLGRLTPCVARPRSLLIVC